MPASMSAAGIQAARTWLWGGSRSSPGEMVPGTYRGVSDSRLIVTACSTSTGATGRAKPLTPCEVCTSAFANPTTARTNPTTTARRAGPSRRVTSSTAQYTPNTMHGTASDAGTAYQWSSASSTRSPNTRAAGAATTITDITDSMRSIEVARPPDRARTMSTIDVMSSTAMSPMTTALTAVGTRSPVVTPVTMAQPTPYISTTADSHSHQQRLSGRGDRRAASHVWTSAGVVYSPLATTANTTR